MHNYVSKFPKICMISKFYTHYSMVLCDSSTVCVLKKDTIIQNDFLIRILQGNFTAI